MLLNCDLGESFGAWKMGLDEEAMPHINMANIACGFHAGDADVMANTLKLAKQHKVQIGAHPSYPDSTRFWQTIYGAKCKRAYKLSALSNCCIRRYGQSTRLKP